MYNHPTDRAWPASVFCNGTEDRLLDCATSQSIESHCNYSSGPAVMCYKGTLHILFICNLLFVSLLTPVMCWLFCLYIFSHHYKICRCNCNYHCLLVLLKLWGQLCLSLNMQVSAWLHHSWLVQFSRTVHQVLARFASWRWNHLIWQVRLDSDYCPWDPEYNVTVHYLHLHLQLQLMSLTYFLPLARAAIQKNKASIFHISCDPKSIERPDQGRGTSQVYNVLLYNP